MHREKEFYAMSQSAKDVQFQELKDMIAQLNNTIRTQSKTIDTAPSEAEDIWFLKGAQR